MTLTPEEAFAEEWVNDYGKRFGIMSGAEIDWLRSFGAAAIEYGKEAKEKAQQCPPHNMVPHAYRGLWGGSVPPPTMICTRCLITS